jgi:acyl-CoA thioester hydrolase
MADTPSHASAAAPAFSWPIRVYYEDTDAGGIVYYANYLKFFERCRTEWLRALGIEQARLVTEHRLQFVVTSLACDYRRPARLDDALTVEARLERSGGASLLFAQRIERHGELLASGRVKVACVDAQTLTPAALPRFLLDALRSPAAP